MNRPINLENFAEATDDELASAYGAALEKARNAPRDMSGNPLIIDGSMAWARFSREAFRIGEEIDWRKRNPGLRLAIIRKS